MQYNYTARDKNGKIKTGSGNFDDEKALALYLRDQGLLLTKMDSRGGTAKKTGRKKLTLFGRVSLVDKIFFTQNLQVMIRAGVSLSKALKILSDQMENQTFKEALETIRDKVESGQPLSKGLELYPKIFPEIFVNMIGAGELSGKLEETLGELLQQMKKDHELVSKIRGAMTYPAVIFVVMIGVMIAMLVFIIPNLTSIFVELKAQLPLPTRIVIAMSDFLRTQGILLAIVLAVLGVLFMRYIKTTSGKKIWHAFLLKLPIFGNIIKKVNLARFSRTLSALLKTDIPIVQSFEITSKVLANYYYKQSILEASVQVKKGSSIVETFSKYPKLYPPVINQMILVGEETGTLDSILTTIAAFYEEDVENVAKNLSSIIEPVLIVFLAGGVGGVAVAVMVPMLDLVNHI
ncbi:MAG TPA: type II secretion system F family protein [Patescibacteria group bacterium]|nr:type II secretion system F family protein [Patescibacteria group bacterium]